MQQQRPHLRALCRGKPRCRTVCLQVVWGAVVVLLGKLDGICTEILTIDHLPSIYAGLGQERAPLSYSNGEAFYREELERLALGRSCGRVQANSTVTNQDITRLQPEYAAHDFHPLSLGRLLTAIRTAAAAAHPPSRIGTDRPSQ